MQADARLLVLGVFVPVLMTVASAASGPDDSHQLIDNLRNQIKAKEEELQQAEAINKNFERMIQLVNILGQVDSFLTDRTKTVIKKLAVLIDDKEDDREEDT